MVDRVDWVYHLISARIQASEAAFFVAQKPLASLGKFGPLAGRSHMGMTSDYTQSDHCHQGISWDFMGFHGISYMISYMISYDFMGFHGISYDFMGFHMISWDFICLPCVRGKRFQTDTLQIDPFLPYQ